MERISLYQLFTLTVFFQIGTTVIFGFSSSSGRDAWISALLCTFIGITIVFLYSILMKMNPGLMLVQWFPAQLGKWIGIPIAWLYPLTFIYNSGRIVSDLKSLVPSTILPETPSWFVVLAMLIVIMYCLFSGIEVLARLSEYLLPVMFILFILEIIFLFSSGLVNFKHVQPFVGHGWGGIWSTVWPTGITQTFGETLVFATIWPTVKSPNKIMKISICATILSGFTLSIFNLIEISVLGENIVKNSIYPLYILVRQISISDFLENLDAMVVLNMIITAYIKITVYLFAVVRSVQILLKIHSNNILLIPCVTFITYFLGMTMSKNINEHNYVGVNIIPLYLWVPTLLILPAFLLLVSALRTKWAKTKEPKSS